MPKIYQVAIVDADRKKKANFEFNDYGGDSNLVGRQDFLDWVNGSLLNMQPGEALLIMVSTDVFQLKEKPLTGQPIIRNGQVLQKP